MANPTTNRGYVLPTVGGSPNTWGAELNDVLGDPGSGPDIDTDMQQALDDAAQGIADAAAAQATADAALPTAGGEMTGRVDGFTSTVTFNNLAPQTGAVNIELATAQFWAFGLSGNIVLTFTPDPGLTAGDFTEFLMLQIEKTGTNTITWPSNIQWHLGATPVQNDDDTDTYVFYKQRGDADWRGRRVIQAMA